MELRAPWAEQHVWAEEHIRQTFHNLHPGMVENADKVYYISYICHILGTTAIIYQPGFQEK